MTDTVSVPLIAVILVAYGGRDDTVACIRSIQKSDYSNYRIILVDNDSPDDTSQFVRGTFPDVLLVESETNLGFAGGNNLGIDKTLELNADYIFLLNNDTEIASDTIGKLVDSAGKSEKLGAIGPKIYYFEKKDIIWSAGGMIDFRWSNLYHRGIRKLDSAEYNVRREVDYLTGCALMFPSERVKEIGKLDESFWMYYEDADFCMRLKRAGYSINYEPGAKVWHKVSSSTGGNLSYRKMWMKFKSGLEFFRRYSPSPFWFLTYVLSQKYTFIKAVFKID
jgi:GT2 family glycosyltransferase